MRLAGLIDPDLVMVPLTADTKEAAVAQMLDAIVRKFPFLDRASIARAISEREEVENTSVGRGFAFPHARSESVDRMYIAVGVANPPIQEAGADQEPLRVMVLLLTPRNIARLYLQTLSAFMMICRNPASRQRLFEVKSAEDVLRIIWDSGVTVQNELVARDIMRRPVIAVKSDATLKEVANLLYRHRISGMPVVDEHNRIVGEISERELIAAAIPDYEEVAGHHAQPASQEPFDELLRREDQITAGQLMTPPVAIVDEEKTVVELAALMLHKNIRRVMVAADGELIGLIMRSDIVSRVIRG